MEFCENMGVYGKDFGLWRNGEGDSVRVLGARVKMAGKLLGV